MNPVSIWSDGGCFPNPGPGGWGAVILRNGVRTELRGHCEQTTNNRMELTGAIEALLWLPEPSGVEVDLYTDSQYLRNGAVHWVMAWQKVGWTRRLKGMPMSSGQRIPIPNADLWQQIARLKELHRIRWHWVRGHADCAENNRADALAQR